MLLCRNGCDQLGNCLNSVGVSIGISVVVIVKFMMSMLQWLCLQLMCVSVWMFVVVIMLNMVMLVLFNVVGGVVVIMVFVLGISVIRYISILFMVIIQWLCMLVSIISLMFFMNVMNGNVVNMLVMVLVKLLVCRLLMVFFFLMGFLMMLLMVRNRFIDFIICMIIIMIMVSVGIMVNIGILKWNGIGSVIYGVLVILWKLFMFMVQFSNVLMIMFISMVRLCSSGLLKWLMSRMVVMMIMVISRNDGVLKLVVLCLLFIQLYVMGKSCRLMMVMMQFVIIGGKNCCSCFISGVVSSVNSLVVMIELYMFVKFMVGLVLMVIIGFMLLNVIFCRIGNCILNFQNLMVCNSVVMFEQNNVVLMRIMVFVCDIFSVDVMIIGIVMVLMYDIVICCKFNVNICWVDRIWLIGCMVVVMVVFYCCYVWGVLGVVFGLGGCYVMVCLCCQICVEIVLQGCVIKVVVDEDDFVVVCFVVLWLCCVKVDEVVYVLQYIVLCLVFYGQDVFYVEQGFCLFGVQGVDLGMKVYEVYVGWYVKVN